MQWQNVKLHSCPQVVVVMDWRLNAAPNTYEWYGCLGGIFYLMFLCSALLYQWIQESRIYEHKVKYPMLTAVICVIFFVMPLNV